MKRRSARALQTPILLVMVLAVMQAPATHGQQPEPWKPPEGLGVYEQMALARMQEVHALGEAINTLTWPGFDPGAQPTVMIQPDESAMAVGFPAAPAGFTAIEGVIDANRPVYRAPAGTFKDAGQPVVRVGDLWAAVARIDAPAIPMSGRRLGRRLAEEEISEFVGDAFVAYLTAARKAPAPYVVGPAGYPDSADLMAMTTMENRVLMRAIQMNFNETNLEDFHKLVRQVIAVRRARWKMMGPDLAAAEKAVEGWDGLRLYNVAQVFRHALSQSYEPVAIGLADPTFTRYNSALLFRQLLINYPMTYVISSPAVTQYLIASRAGSLAYLVDRLDRGWYPALTAGDKTLIDVLNEKVELKPEAEAGLLEETKKIFRYDATLRLAQSDLEIAVKQREKVVAQQFPPGSSRLEINLKGARAVSYLDDPRNVSYLGGGLLVHPGRLEFTSDGVRLEAAPLSPAAMTGRPDLASRPLILTRAKTRRDEVAGVVLALPAGMAATVGGKAPAPGEKPTVLSASAPLELKAVGFSLTVSAGKLRTAPDGGILVEIP